MRRMMTAIGLGLSAVLVTSGCQLVGGGNDAKSSKPAQTTKGTSGQQAQAAPSPQSSPGAPAVSKSLTMPIPGDPGQTYTLGFSSLQVKGQLAVLTLVWTPHGIGSETININNMTTGEAPAAITPDVALIDKTNLKRYVVVSDSDQNALSTSDQEAETGNNQPLTATYWFAAPPANADLDVTLGSRPVFESVQVTR